MRSSKTIVIAIAGVGLIAGCATKPPPTHEEIQQQSGVSKLPLKDPWRAAPVSTNAIRDNWLATFEDQQLDALIVEAVAHNPDLRMAALTVAEAAQYVQLAKAAMRPSVNILGTGGFNMGGGDVSSALQGVSLGVSWEPDLWGRLRYGRNAAQLTYASTEADYEFARQSLAATVAKGWFTATETQLEMQIADDMVSAGKELLDLAGQRQNVGAGNEQDVTLARANLGNFQDTARQAKLAHENALRALELLLGRYPAAELASRSELCKLPGDLSAGLPIQMLERRPDMIAAERRVAAAFNRVGEAKTARLPRIILNANAAVVESDVLQLKKDFQNPTGGFGAKMIAPLYQGGALNTQIKIRTLKQKEAVVDYARMALRALDDVEGALAMAQALSDRERLLGQVLDDSQQTLTLVKASYRVGRSDMRAVQQQQVSVNAARLSLLRVQNEQRIQRVNLHLALGGSFENPAPEQVTLKTEKTK